MDNIEIGIVRESFTHRGHYEVYSVVSEHIKRCVILIDDYEIDKQNIKKNINKPVYYYIVKYGEYVFARIYEMKQAFEYYYDSVIKWG